MIAFQEALEVWSAGSFPRVDRIQLILSDSTTEPLPRLDTQSAHGVNDPGERGD